jgi:hypothetical protein
MPIDTKSLTNVEASALEKILKEAISGYPVDFSDAELATLDSMWHSLRFTRDVK